MQHVNGNRFWKTALLFLLSIIIFVGGNSVLAGIVPPRGGGKLPPEYVQLKKRLKGAFTLKHSWIERRRIQVQGEEIYHHVLSSRRSPLSHPERAVSGRLAIPVVLGLYVEIPEPPIPYTELQEELFTGPWASGTLHDYYGEVSFGLLDVGGNVFDWVFLSQVEVYYTGGIGRGLSPGLSRTGEMIKEILDALDPTVDFGSYDNDGPDGYPNSGDDDGFVDILIVVHPTIGAECNNSLHMWSHSWIYSGWPASGGQPYATNDGAAGGGTVLIDDYIIGPALSCDQGIIEIGVFCHELGHALGLPDLYDANGGSSGIGYWGLMGAGNWNTPVSPTHLCAWSREQLGWVEPVEIDWREASLTLQPVGSSGEAVKLNLPSKRFRRSKYVPAGDMYALICGYTQVEASTRDWPGGEGYGNEWNESMFRLFHADDSRPITLQYDVSIDVEAPEPPAVYDFGLLLLESNGSVDTLAFYTGTSSTREIIDLSGRLPAGPCDFVLRFQFISDFNVSDEDGYYDSRGGWTFHIDDISIAGGGIDYFTSFEDDAGGWCSDSDPVEYFIVENRRRFGFDSHLPGEGLLIWHAENSIIYSLMGNTGGFAGTQARGLVLEEADGQYNLLLPDGFGGNFGDTGDPFPGSSSNTSFGPGTFPSSKSNGGWATPVRITDITRSSGTSSAVFHAGMPEPVIHAVQPDSVDKLTESEVTLDITGESFQCGAQCYLSFGVDTVRPVELDWWGEERLMATFQLDELFAGSWDVTVVSGDGQEAMAPEAFMVVSVYEAARVRAGRDYLLAEWTLRKIGGIRGCHLFRSASGGTFERISDDTLRSPEGEFRFTDPDIQPEVDYSYRIITYITGVGEESLTLRGPYRITDLPFIADQNFPNPFSDRTTISFFVPSMRTVSIDIFDVAGRRVASLGTEAYGRGTHRIEWVPSSDDLQTGIYFCVFRLGRTMRVVKMVLLR